MKAGTFSAIIYFSGLGFFAIMAAFGINIIYFSDKITDTVSAGVFVALSGIVILVGLGIFNLIANASTNYDIHHIKNILKKNGLWQDEEIKKKDLPK